MRMIKCNLCNMFIWDQGARKNDAWREKHLREVHPGVSDD